MSESVCNWTSISCNSDKTSVVTINLASIWESEYGQNVLNLTYIPSNLQKFIVNGNSFYGDLNPANFPNSLTYFKIRKTHFNILDSNMIYFQNLTNLQQIDIDYCDNISKYILSNVNAPNLDSFYARSMPNWNGILDFRNTSFSNNIYTKTADSISATSTTGQVFLTGNSFTSVIYSDWGNYYLRVSTYVPCNVEYYCKTDECTPANRYYEICQYQSQCENSCATCCNADWDISLSDGATLTVVTFSLGLSILAVIMSLLYVILYQNFFKFDIKSNNNSNNSGTTNNNENTDNNNSESNQDGSVLLQLGVQNGDTSNVSKTPASEASPSKLANRNNNNNDNNDNNDDTKSQLQQTAWEYGARNVYCFTIFIAAIGLYWIGLLYWMIEIWWYADGSAISWYGIGLAAFLCLMLLIFIILSKSTIYQIKKCECERKYCFCYSKVLRRYTTQEDNYDLLTIYYSNSDDPVRYNNNPYNGYYYYIKYNSKCKLQLTKQWELCKQCKINLSVSPRCWVQNRGIFWCAMAVIWMIFFVIVMWDDMIQPLMDEGGVKSNVAYLEQLFSVTSGKIVCVVTVGLMIIYNFVTSSIWASSTFAFSIITVSTFTWLDDPLGMFDDPIANSLKREHYFWQTLNAFKMIFQACWCALAFGTIMLHSALFFHHNSHIKALNTLLIQFYFHIVDIIATLILIYIWFFTKQFAYASIQVAILVFEQLTQTLIMPKYLPNHVEIQWYERLFILAGISKLWFGVKMWQISAINDRKHESKNDYIMCKIWGIVKHF